MVIIKIKQICEISSNFVSDDLEVALIGMNMLPARVGNFPTYCPILTARVVNMLPAHAYRRYAGNTSGTFMKV